MIDKSRIYVGYNKNNKRCLLYELDENRYKDLEEKTIYTSSDIYLSSLVRYSELIYMLEDKSLFAKKFVDAYQKDKRVSIDLSKVFIAPVYTIIDKTNLKCDGYNYSATLRLKMIKTSELLLDDGFFAVNLFSNQKYNQTVFSGVRDLYVSPDDRFKKTFSNEFNLSGVSYLPKRKVLQLYVDKYGVE